MEDDVEVRNDCQQLQKTRAQVVKGKMSSPTINEKETEIHGTKCYEKEVMSDILQMPYYGNFLIFISNFAFI